MARKPSRQLAYFGSQPSFVHAFSLEAPRDVVICASTNSPASSFPRLRVTYYANWFDGTTQRHPRVRFGNPVHVVNNY
jgi:pectate lyase